LFRLGRRRRPGDLFLTWTDVFGTVEPDPGSAMA
jgi:hypothetical protein